MVRESIDEPSMSSWTKLVFDSFLDSSLGPLMDPWEGPRLVVLGRFAIRTLV